MVEKKPWFLNIKAIIVSAYIILIFILISVYIETQARKSHYFMYILGINPTENKGLIQVVSGDGVIAQTAEISVNEQPSPTQFLKLSPFIKTIEINLANEKTIYPVSYEKLMNKRHFKQQKQSFTEKEIDLAARILSLSKIGKKEIFLLPETLRMVPEYDIKFYLFCFEENLPCKESELSFQGNLVPMKKGVAEMRTKLPINNEITIGFDASGEQGKLSFPFIGRMFMINNTLEGLFFSTLTESRGIYLDCYKNESWVFTESSGSLSRGGLLPPIFQNCDRIQASFNPENPGSSYFIFIRENNKPVQIHDPYFSELWNKIDSNLPEWREKFQAIYAQSEFYTLNRIYDGSDYEKERDTKRKSDLNMLWWAIAVTGFLGIASLVFYLLRKVSVHIFSDEDGMETIISKSRFEQHLTIGVLAVVLSVFYILALYVLRYLS